MHPSVAVEIWPEGRVKNAPASAMRKRLAHDDSAGIGAFKSPDPVVLALPSADPSRFLKNPPFTLREPQGERRGP